MTASVAADAPLRAALPLLGRGAVRLRGAAGVLTDADVRRALLTGATLDAPCRSVARTPAADVVPERVAAAAVVMAGGPGERLRPLTDAVPKPMLPVGGRPLLEAIVDQLRRAGVRRVYLATHYRADVIERHFRDGARFGIQIRHVVEQRPLGTAGALGLLNGEPSDPLLVMNGDVVCDVDLRAMRAYHERHGADVTIAVHPLDTRLPYGLVEIEGTLVRGIDEKPTVRHLVNAGIYLVGARGRAAVPARRCDFPELIQILAGSGHHLVAFPLYEQWLDIGRPGDYLELVRNVSSQEVAP